MFYSIISGNTRTPYRGRNHPSPNRLANATYRQFACSFDFVLIQTYLYAIKNKNTSC